MGRRWGHAESLCAETSVVRCYPHIQVWTSPELRSVFVDPTCELPWLECVWEGVRHVGLFLFVQVQLSHFCGAAPPRLWFMCSFFIVSTRGNSLKFVVVSILSKADFKSDSVNVGRRFCTFILIN